MTNRETRSHRNSFNHSAYIAIVILFAVALIILIGIRKSIVEYHQGIHQDYTEDRMETFNSVLIQSCMLGNFGLLNSSAKIQQDINMELDLDKLKDCFSNNLQYPEFDQILRSTLQNNVYTVNKRIDQTRNSIFVMLNGKIIAYYGHDLNMSSPLRLGDGITPDELINGNFYNEELSHRAINLLQDQYKGLIIWQERQPSNDNIPVYSSINLQQFKDIFKEYGIEGLDSFDILLPVYITEYGNIFGDYDIPGLTNSNSDNKIILVQKLNLKDYVSSYFPDLFDHSTEQSINDRFGHVITMLNIFITLECMAMIAYAFAFIAHYNNKLAMEKLEDAMEEELRICRERKKE